MHARQKNIAENVSKLDEIYTQLATLFNEFKNTSVLLIAGDFYAKVGKSKDSEMCLGKYSRGTRNNTGQSLIDFCIIHQLLYPTVHSNIQHDTLQLRKTTKKILKTTK